VVVGGGVGGSAAAIQAARSGLAVAILEESDYIGGQIAGAAVSTMDDLGRTRTGLYEEFIDLVRSHYSALGVATNICLWGGDTIATEPAVARDILTGLINSSGKADIYLLTQVTKAIMDGSRITGVEALRGDSSRAGEFGETGEKIIFDAGVFIDATEYGDLLPLAGAAYRVGSAVSGSVNPEANVQDITYVAVVKKYPGGLPESLRMPGPPPLYERYAPRFRKTVILSGDRWPGSYPFDVPSHNAYRALPDPANTALIIGDDPETWQFITKTCVNWANDFPGNGGNKPGLSVMYIEDADYRKKIEREAMNKTLAFIWYMQNELGMADWSVDDSQGYGGWFSNGWDSESGAYQKDDPLLPPDFAPILRCFPPFPYVREGRRIVGVETLTQSDISRGSFGRPARFKSGIALGEYPVDVHGSRLDRYMEREFGESSASFPRTWVPSKGVFQVPFGVFIPERVNGLIAAEKNISVSRMACGAVRVQPAAFHTGQAAGTIAAESVRSCLLPRHVNVLSVQKALMESGCWIAPEKSDDAPKGSPYWSAVQLASLYEAIPKISHRSFGVSLPITADQLSKMVLAAYGEQGPDIKDIKGIKNLGDEKYLSKREFLESLSKFEKQYGLDPHSEKYLSDLSDPDLDLSLTRGDAARIIFGSL
jgi:hypothetical protein